MAEQTSGKTTSKAAPRKAATSVPVTTTSVAPTGQPVATATASPSTQAQQPPSPRPEPSPRSGVRVNVGVVETAFVGAGASRAVRAIQYALAARGFAPGNRDGRVDHDTRAAYAEYQRTIGERPTGVPTEDSLDHLGFDVVG